MATRTVTGLFGPFVDSPVRDAAPSGAPGEFSPRLRRTDEPEDLVLEVGVVSRGLNLDPRRCLTTSCSVVLHSAGLVAIVAVPLLLATALPAPADAVSVFFAEPMIVPPPPPPPPAAAARQPVERPAPVVKTDEPEAFVAPIQVPAELRPEEGFDLGIDGGVVGGVEGGVPGGIVGGVVGGLPDWATAPPPKVGPLRVSGLIKEPTKVRHVPPVYPAVAVAARIQGSVVMEALVDVGGKVTQVDVLEGDKLFIEAALEAVRQWAYSPTLLDGIPVPVIVTVTVNFELGD